MSEDPDRDDHDLIVRIDERVKQAINLMEQRDVYYRQDMDRMLKMFQDTIGAFTATIANMSQNYISRTEWAGAKNDISRLERLIYGAVAVILLSFIGGLVVLVWGAPGPGK